mmetsp:Transcript_23545/g.51436  ORF Transcript_23545/g.51436 Transcript_23545/m.51436 type:complete len:127 (-) Transcript_23545:1166-1546(-)|eukprot:4638646-Pleurochrysis_carterae.AAC.1
MHVCRHPSPDSPVSDSCAPQAPLTKAALESVSVSTSGHTVLRLVTSDVKEHMLWIKDAEVAASLLTDFSKAMAQKKAVVARLELNKTMSSEIDSSTVLTPRAGRSRVWRGLGRVAALFGADAQTAP